VRRTNGPGDIGHDAGFSFRLWSPPDQIGSRATDKAQAAQIFAGYEPGR
jgi:hypothetical protein